VVPSAARATPTTNRATPYPNWLRIVPPINLVVKFRFQLFVILQTRKKMAYSRNPASPGGLAALARTPRIADAANRR
jgi:hypothetical protein